MSIPAIRALISSHPDAECSLHPKYFDILLLKKPVTSTPISCCICREDEVALDTVLAIHSACSNCFCRDCLQWELDRNLQRRTVAVDNNQEDPGPPLCPLCRKEFQARADGWDLGLSEEAAELLDAQRVAFHRRRAVGVAVQQTDNPDEQCPYGNGPHLSSNWNPNTQRGYLCDPNIGHVWYWWRDDFPSLDPVLKIHPKWLDEYNGLTHSQRQKLLVFSLRTGFYLADLKWSLKFTLDEFDEFYASYVEQLGGEKLREGESTVDWFLRIENELAECNISDDPPYSLAWRMEYITVLRHVWKVGIRMMIKQMGYCQDPWDEFTMTDDEYPDSDDDIHVRPIRSPTIPRGSDFWTHRIAAHKRNVAILTARGLPLHVLNTRPIYPHLFKPQITQQMQQELLDEVDKAFMHIVSREQLERPIEWNHWVSVDWTQSNINYVAYQRHMGRMAYLVYAGLKKVGLEPPFLFEREVVVDYLEPSKRAAERRTYAELWAEVQEHPDHLDTWYEYGMGCFWEDYV